MTAPSTLPELQAGAPDEALFWETLRQFGAIHFSWGYGPPFWALLKATDLLFAPDSAIALTRALFASLKYVAFIVGFFGLWQTGRRGAGVFFLFLVLSTPGYLFFGKIVSPEYLLLFWIALTFFFLVRDQGRWGPSYYTSLFFAFLAATTKISLAPLLGTVPLYAVSRLLLEGGIAQWKRPLKLGLASAAFLSFCTVLLFLLYPPDMMLKDIQSILSIVPPWELSSARLNLAWSRQDVTWDQIILGGIKADFLPGFVALLLAIVLTTFRLVRRRSDALLPAFLLAAALSMLANSVFHGLACSWYLFPPFFLASLAFGLSLPKSLGRWGLALVILFCGLLAFSGAKQLAFHILLKQDGNAQLAAHAKLWPQIQELLTAQAPCAQTGALDILVPGDEESARDPDAAKIIPARTALKRASIGKDQTPDFFVVNRSTYHDQSPMLGLIIKDKLSAYSQIGRRKDLELYVRTSLIGVQTCHGN